MLNKYNIHVETSSESNELSRVINEMVIQVDDRTTKEVRYADEHSIVYGRLRQRLHNDIIKFCLNEVDLKNDLMFFRSMVGDTLRERDINNFVKDIQAKYNNNRGYNKNVGIDYFIESTRYDFVLVLFVIIVRGANIHSTRFVFRYRKGNITDGVYGQDLSGLPVNK